MTPGGLSACQSPPGVETCDERPGRVVPPGPHLLRGLLTRLAEMHVAAGRRRTAGALLGLMVITGCGPATSSSPSVAALPSATHASSDPLDLGTLAAGGRLDGAPLVIDGVGSADYAVAVEPTDGHVRVSLDLSNRDDCVTLSVRDPSGTEVPASGPVGPVVCPHDANRGTPQAFDIDLSGEARPGRWTAHVEVSEGRRLASRLRIIHEPAHAPAPATLQPDLVPWLPWEFAFAAPGSDNPGTAHDRDNQPGDPTVSCHPEEEPDDTRCLRFSAGVYNVGDGPLSVVFRDDVAYQHIYRPDGTPLDHADNEAAGVYEEREAGHGEWHEFHRHRHLGDMVLYELFAVASSDGGLTGLDTGRKHGYCTFSQQIADWDSTAQDPQWASLPTDGAFCDTTMTLERGWGDIYRWQRPGQYLAYDAVAEPDGSMRAGHYLVRFTVDPLDNIEETDEGNNIGYALVEVRDGGGLGQDSIVVCEQGSGTDPWDSAHIVVPYRFAWATEALEPGAAPASCS